MIRGASSILIHPDWDFFKDSYDADIAMIKMNQQVTYTRLIKPVCMPYATFDVFSFTGVIAGYGLTENSITFTEEKSAKHVEIPSTTQESCFLDYPEYARLLSTRTFCGGQKGKIPCK